MRENDEILRGRVFGSRELRYRIQDISGAVVSFLVQLMLWCGCFVTHPLKRDPSRGRPLPGDRFLTVWLGTDDYIEVAPFCYVEVREPSDFIYGSGGLIDATGYEWEFNGRIESLTPFIIARGGGGTGRHPGAGSPVYHFALSDGTVVRFGEGCFVRVRREEGAGFWCAGTRVQEHKRIPFAGRIPFGDIRGIDEHSITVGMTLKIGFYVCAGIAVLLGLLLVRVFGV